MLNQTITSISLESFQETTQGKKIVLIYPWLNYRNVFLSYFMNEGSEGLLYYRIRESHISLSKWLTKLVNEFDSVLGGFGKNLQSALSSGSPSELGEAFAKDLDEWRKDEIVIFIDEIDRISHDKDFVKFFRSFVIAMPKQAQLVLNSRMLTYRPWMEFIEKDEAVVLRPKNWRNDLMFTAEDSPRPQIEIYGFGSGHVLVNGIPIETWDGALPRNLFFYFVDNHLVTRDQIFGMFWPNLGVKEATNVFHVTKRKITERISMCVQDGGNHELTRYSAGFYMPSEKVVRHYDVAEFEEVTDQVMMAEDEEEKEILYRQAIDLCRAPFLQTVDMPWVLERREQLRTRYAEALIGMGRINRKRGNIEQALGFYVRSLKEVPQREDIHREVMKIYVDLGRRHDVVNQYRTLEEHLKRTIGIEPSKDTKKILDLLEYE